MKPYYDHAGITIYHGDCLEVLPSLAGVDLVLTDPPYNLSLALLAKGNSSFDDSLETYVVNARQDPVNAVNESLPLDAGHPVHAALNEGGGPGATPGYVVSYAINASQERHIRNAWNTTYVSEETDPDRVREATGPTRRVDLSMFCQCKDSPRYRGLGNGVTATVAEWIGRRIRKYATLQLSGIRKPPG